ncbi:homoprotocatechuate degradation operon regulator HpaR [uncultured Pelagimonas sp.]|uniref:homoprotocatechuate degradation operon regulator HpaR n=1 Tax=uncultured Pelagimonas sp. TaxID=1618102 RepID=UPI0026300300|nr:homoprotocatechuate degradation operon regulator HpaR [uncultured Pelagimonas sp.]
MKTLPTTARSLPIALIRAREGVMSPIRDMLSETGITEQQWRILRILAEYGRTDSKTVADRSSLLFSSLTRIAATLREKGLITQTRDHEDRRRQFIEITPEGQRLIDDHASQAAQIVAGFKETLGEENYETLLDLLAMLDPNAKPKP